MDTEYWYIYTMEYYSAIKKEWNNAICSNMDGPGDYHTKWSKSDTERPISYDLAYMWNLNKMIQINLFRKQTHRLREQTYGYWGESWGKA